ncbi:hypothetical protein Dcar01_03396 [Deinococcus carri]|uniref:DUF11 domain-containing protein n=1 Tax=Deinococcus carri TaxID=1211323 RepID=A0ABP9WDU3_9DEIO
MKRLLQKLLPFLGLLSVSASAQTNTGISSTPRMQQSGRVDYVALGASFRTDNGNGGNTCTVKTGTTTTSTGSGNLPNGEVVANNAVVQASDRSAAQLVPTGSTIKAAYLYWVASQNSDDPASADKQVTFIVNGVPNTVTASRVWTGVNSNGGSMGAFADVTGLMGSVTAANATMRMDGLSIQNNGDQCRNATVHGAWTLYIVYENAGLSSKLISFYDGLEYIGGSAGIANKTITASGFSVPNASSLDRVSKVSVMVADGDYDAAGDSLSLKSNLNTAATTQSSASRGAGNFFGGVVSAAAEDGTETRQTGSVNTAASTTGGLDIATIFAPTSVIPAGTGTITATIDSQAGELLITHSLVVMANTSNANVRIAKTLEGTATTYRVGDALKYLLTVDNRQGTYEALNVVTTDTLPRGLTYNGTEISYDGGTSWAALSGVTTSVDATGVTTITLPAVRRLDNDGKVWGGTGSVATQLGTQDVKYRLSVTANGAVTGSLNNQANVTTGSAETATTDNSSSASVTILPQADLAVTKTDGVSSVMYGSDTVYTVRVTNAGPAAVTDAVLQDPAVSGLSVSGVSCSAATGNRCAAPPTAAQLQSTGGATLPALASGEFFELQVTANVTASGSVTNTAQVSLPSGSGVTDPVPGNNTAADTDSVVLPSGPAVPPGVWSASTCLDFSGVALSVNGAPVTKTLTTPEGVLITYTLDVTSNAQYGTGNTPSNPSGEAVLNGYVPGSWSGDRWDDYFGSGKTNAVVNRPVGRKVGYTLSAYATYGGQAVPLTLLTGSAEDDASNEYVMTTTNGTPFAVVDRTVASTVNGTLTVSGSGTTAKMTVDSANGNFLLLGTTKMDATAAAPLVLTNELAGNGATAQGYCLAYTYDRGDAPSSYLRAAHLQYLSFGTTLANGTYNLRDAAVAPSAATSRTSAFLGGQPTSEATERGTNGTADSDDAVPGTLPTLGNNAATYSVTLAYTNASGAPVTLAGWVDFDGNGTFDAGERTTTSLVAGSGNVTLTWNGISANSNRSAARYARFRISSDATSAGNPSGTAPDGEVEDYPVPYSVTPDLTLTKAGPAYAKPSTVANTDPAAGPVVAAGDSFISYTLTVNTAGADATGTTTVTDTLPAGLSWTPSGNYTAGPGSWTCGVSGQTITCTTSSTITVGTPQTITLNNVRVGPGTAAGATFTNTATVANPNEAAADKNAGNTGTASTKLVLTQVTKEVRLLPGATFGKSASVRPGDVLEYCIDTRNLGGADLTNYVLSDTLNSSGRSLTSITTDTAYGGKAIKWTRTPASGTATTASFTAVAGDDAGTLTDSSLSVNLGTLVAGETVRTCFQVQVR